MEDLKLIMDAIHAKKVSISEAKKNNVDIIQMEELVGDLISLENCLVTQVEQFLKNSC